MRRVSSMVLAAVMAFGVIAQPLQAYAAGETTDAVKDYEIFPIPHSITYQDGSYILRDTVNVVYEAGVDDATKARVQEIAALKNLTLVEQPVVEGQTNLMVGIAGNEDTTVDEYIESKQLSDADLLTKTDSYILSSQNGTIAILGKDVDSSFYGATTLYHVVKQLESRTIRNFLVKDFADVVSRGFIEGYYGNPWSTQDRINLMEWGGYYKLNSYFYAPKDDPKHNANWKELYTPEEIEAKIKPLAAAGNNSKCRFVFALHPYMHNPIRYDTEEHYQEDMNAMKAKFAQVIEAGVRQIAILADDAGRKRPQDYKRTLDDMTAWIKEMQKTYPDLKLNLPFCVQEYMNGVSWLPDYYTTFPENVQIMVTGGAVWGDVYKGYNTPFTQKFGRAPYLWVNWPCSDNSKNNLVMGGYQVLHSDVEPGTVAGIVLNPMQQSEPSKVGIFGNACYSWNIWTDEERAMAYDASFKYVEHNSAIETPASSALRELSKHMQNHLAGGSPRHNESVELAPKLNAFNQALANGSLTAQQVDEMIAEFAVLQDAAKTLRAEGNPKLLGDINKPYTAPEANEQMAPWIDCWDDTTAAAIAYLNAIKASLGDAPDFSVILKEYNAGMEAFSRARSHEFYYVNHMEKAQVGRQHIEPFIKNLSNHLSRLLQQELDPDVLIKTYISDVLTNPVSGDFDDIFDGNDATAVEFHEPLYIKEGNYFGVKFNQPINVTDIRVAMANGKNHFYHSKLQYTQDGSAWVDVNGEVYDRLLNDDTPIVVADLNLTGVKGLRLIATADNGVDAWITIKSFDVNAQGGSEGGQEVVSYPVTADQVTIENAVVADSGHNKNKLVDGDKGTELWLKKSADGADRDTTPAGVAVVLDLGEVKTVGSVYFAQGATAAGDVIDAGVVEYSTDNATWHQLGTLNSDQEQTITASAPVQARYIRVKNTQDKSIWWRLGEVTVYSANAPAVTPTYTGSVTVEGAVVPNGYPNNNTDKLMDGSKNTELWITDRNGGYVTDKAAAVVDLGEEKTIGSVYFAQGTTQPNDVINAGVVEYSTDKVEWKELGKLDNRQEQTITLTYPVNARYIRVRNTEQKPIWWRMAELTVYGPAPLDGRPDPHVYTNVEKTGFHVNMTTEDAAMTAGTVTLQPGEYIGIDLGEIRELSSIQLPADLKGTTFQISANATYWTDVTAEQAASMMALTADNISTSQIVGRRVRYLRLINNTNAAVELNVDKFLVKNAVVGQLGKLVSSDIGNRGWGDTRNDGKAFDGNVNEATKFGGNPMQGNTAVYSLGREMNIHSIRVYNTDGECDYIRDAKIQLSTDGKTWKDALVIGDGVTDTDRETAFGNINDPAKKTDSNYPNKFYYGNDAVAAEVGEGARFLRVLITADYPERALVMNEIMLNEGKYISPETNMSFEGTLEAPGHIPSNMLDKDLSTTYKPGSANGHITYTLSDASDLTAIRFIQNGAVSHAVVTAEAYKNNATETVTLGTLSQAVNEFVVPAGTKLLSVTVTWTDKLPEIAEILLMKHNVEVGDKTELETLAADGHKPEGFDTWTENAQNEYLAVKEEAKKVLTSEYASQTTVDSMAAALRAAGQNTNDKIKADADTVKALQALVDGKASNDQHFYTDISYAAYEAQLAKAAAALKDQNNLTVEAAEKLIADINSAREALQFSAYQREVATLTVEGFAAVKAEDYSKKSYADLAAAKAAVDALLADASTQPQAFFDATAAYTAAYKALYPVAELNALIAKKPDANLYTEASFAKYTAAKKAAADLLNSADATNKQLDDAKNALVAAEKALELKGDDADLKALIAEMRKEPAASYTKASYDNLTAALDAAEALLKSGKATPEAIETAKQNILVAKKALVSVVELNAKLDEAAKLNKDNYTAESYKALADAMEKAAALKVNGTAEQIKQAVNDLTAKIAALVPYVKPDPEVKPDATPTPVAPAPVVPAPGPAEGAETGDNSAMMLWSLLGAISLGGAVTTLSVKKRRSAK